MKPQSYQSASGMLPLASLARRKGSTPFQKAFLPTVNSCLFPPAPTMTTSQRFKPSCGQKYRMYFESTTVMSRKSTASCPNSDTHWLCWIPHMATGRNHGTKKDGRGSSCIRSSNAWCWRMRGSQDPRTST